MEAEDTLPLLKKRTCANNICMQKDKDHDTLLRELAKETDEFQRDHLATANPENVSQFLKRLKTLLDLPKPGLNNAKQTDVIPDLQGTSGPEIKQRVARNHMIVMRIMDHLGSRSLLVSRLVSKIWLEVATKILQNSKRRALFFRVSFTWSSFKNDYENFRMGTLADFTDFLDLYPSPKSTNNFPTRQFRFDGGGNLKSTHARIFFQKHGPNFVHHLILDLKPKAGAEEGGKTGIDTLRHLLLDWLPNLRRLQLVNTPWETDGADNPDKRLFSNPDKKRMMPALRVLVLDNLGQIPRNLVLDLLTASPNLEKIEDEPVRFLDQIISAEKCGTLTSLGWAFKAAEVERLTTFVQTKPAIKQLGLALGLRNSADQWPACTNLINQLLESCADSLEDWGFLPSMDFLQGLVIPVMTKLHTIYINEEIKHANHKIFPPTLTPIIASRFPSVHSLTFSDPNKRFSTESTVSKKAAGWVKIMHEAFPHLHDLSFEIVTMSEIPDFYRAVWKLFCGLKGLRVIISYETTTIDKYLCSDLDSAITGIPVQVCRNLRRALRVQSLKKGLSDENKASPISIPSNAQQVDLLRQEPSICDLKNLVKFELYWKNFGETFSQPPLYSDVSKVYGFNLMPRPDFKVTSWHGFYAGRVVDKMDRSLHLQIH